MRLCTHIVWCETDSEIKDHVVRWVIGVLVGYTSGINGQRASFAADEIYSRVQRKADRATCHCGRDGIAG